MSLNWYVKKGNQPVRGPFPAKQLAQEFLLGRLTGDDLVSQDAKYWKKVREVRALIPDVLKGDHSSPEFLQRLEAARRWADERRVEHVTSTHDQDQRQSAEQGGRHISNETAMSRRKWKILLPVLLVLLLSLSVVWLAFEYAPEHKQPLVDCSSAPAAGINWQYCQLDGAILAGVDLREATLNNVSMYNASLLGSNLQYAKMNFARLGNANLASADFSHAILKGADLQGADLRLSRFQYADMRYANLKKAIIQQADFSHAKLDHAIWTDGRECLAGSTGRCLLR